MLKPFGGVFRGCQKPSSYALVKPRNISARMKRTTGRHAKFLFCNLGKQEQNGADDILDYRCRGTRFNPLKRCYLVFALSLAALRATQLGFWGKSDVRLLLCLPLRD